jgi:hypothetical protein
LEYFEWAGNVIAGCRDANQRLAEGFDELVKEARSLILTQSGS